MTMNKIALNRKLLTNNQNLNLSISDECFGEKETTVAEDYLHTTYILIV